MFARTVPPRKALYFAAYAALHIILAILLLTVPAEVPGYLGNPVEGLGYRAVPGEFLGLLGLFLLLAPCWRGWGVKRVALILLVIQGIGCLVTMMETILPAFLLAAAKLLAPVGAVLAEINLGLWRSYTCVILTLVLYLLDISYLTAGRFKSEVSCKSAFPFLTAINIFAMYFLCFYGSVGVAATELLVTQLGVALLFLLLLLSAVTGSKGTRRFALAALAINFVGTCIFAITCSNLNGIVYGLLFAISPAGAGSLFVIDVHIMKTMIAAAICISISAAALVLGIVLYRRADSRLRRDETP